MKLVHFLLLALACIGAVYAWDKEDHEIFEIVSALEAAEGKGTNFYSFLDVASTASKQEIDRAFRKKSITFHPDKVKDPKDAPAYAEKYARYSVISGILRSEDQRKRYDFFYKNGVPKWKGTGYLYARWRPGFGTVLVFLSLLTAAFQLLFQTLNHKRDVARLSRVIDDALKAAGTAGAKKVKIEVGGSIRECSVTADGEVYLLDPPHEPYHLTLDSLHAPSFRTTWPASLGRALLSKAGLGAKEVEEFEQEAEEVVEDVKETVKRASGREKKNGAKRR